jgi:hypothetical protein
MKKPLLAALLLVGGLNGVHASEPDASFRLLLGTGLTFGGYRLATVTYSNGYSQDINGGSLVQVYAGGEFRLNDSVSLQGTAGYHFNESSGASDGSVRFSRVPLELIAIVRVVDSVRVGAGVRRALNPKLEGSGVASNINVKFNDSTSLVVEGEYLFTPHIGLKARYVNEKYQPSSGGSKVSGKHTGVMFNYYF